MPSNQRTSQVVLEKKNGKFIQNPKTDGYYNDIIRGSFNKVRSILLKNGSDFFLFFFFYIIISFCCPLIRSPNGFSAEATFGFEHAQLTKGH